MHWWRRRAALFRGGDGRWQMFAIRDGRAQLQAIETGLMNDEAVEVKNGLQVGELVVVAPETSLKDGVRVKAIERIAGRPDNCRREIDKSS